LVRAYVDPSEKEKSRLLFQVRMFLGQLENKRIVLDQEELKDVDSLTGKENVAFPDPIGATDIVYLSHPEPASMSITLKEKGIQPVDAKIHVSNEFRQKVKLLWDLGFASSKPLIVRNNDSSREKFWFI